MGFLKNIVGKLVDKDSGLKKGDEVVDKQLQSLRRQRQRQQEELEKVRLKKDIKRFQNARTSRNMFGSGSKSILRDDMSVTREDVNLLTSTRKRPRKGKGRVGFLK